jgi:hypothetical protein
MKMKFRWECHWDKGTGMDREHCNCKGGWSSLETAIKNGKLHNNGHRWEGWGYAPNDFRNQTVNIYRKTPAGKLKIEKYYHEL